MAGLIVFPGAMPSRSRNGGAIAAELYFYENNTTIPKTIWADEALTVPLPFPVVSDDAGRFPGCWAEEDDPYTVAWATADGQTLVLDDLTASEAADAMILDETEAAIDYIQSLVEGYEGAVLYEFDTATTDSDPGPGKIRFDNATLSGVTELYIDNTDLNAVDATTWLDSFGDANPGGNRGTLTVRSMIDATKFAVFYITGDTVDSTGYRTVPVEWIDGDARPEDATNVSVSFAAAGPQGEQGDAGWTPVFAVVNDGARRVEQVVSWTGGGGTPPASGLYVGASGFVVNIADGVDIRGPSGAGTGDMLYSENLAYMASNSQSRINLGLGTAAVLNAGTAVNNVIQWGGTSTYPAGDGSAITGVHVPYAYSTKTTGFTAVLGDWGAAFALNDTFTLALTAAATLGAGWYIDVIPLSTGGIVTIDPNGSELIDELSSILAYPTESAYRIYCNGTGFYTEGRDTRVMVESWVPTATAQNDFEVAFVDPEAASIDFEVVNVAGPSAAALQARLKTGGSYITSGDYSTGFVEVGSNGTNVTDTAIPLSNGSTAVKVNGCVTVFGQANTAANSTAVSAQMSSKGTGFLYPGIYSGGLNTQAAAITGLRFRWSTAGNFVAQGQIRSYVNRQ